MLKPALEALKNTLLASAQPITAAIHRTWAQQIIDELYNADSRAAVLAGTTTTSPTLVAGDKVFIVRAAAGLLIDSSAFNSLTDSLQRNITKVSHGFVVGNVLTLDGSGVFVKVTDPTANKFVGVVTAVVSTSVFRVALAGYITGLSGLTPGSVYYATASGTLSTTPSDMPVLIAGSATTGYIMGGSGGSGAIPSSQSQSEAVADGANTSSTSGLSNDRTIGELSLYYFIRKFITLAWTWTLTQTFTAGTIHSNVTASLMAAFDSSKRLVSIAYAAATDLLTGTDGTKPITSLALSSYIDFVTKSCSVSSGTMTLDLVSVSKVAAHFYNSSAISSGFTVSFSNNTAAEMFVVHLLITGGVSITMPSSVVMQENEVRWNNSTKILTLTGGTGSGFQLSFTKRGSVYELIASSKFFAS